MNKKVVLQIIQEKSLTVAEIMKKCVVSDAVVFVLHDCSSHLTVKEAADLVDNVQPWMLYEDTARAMKVPEEEIKYKVGRLREMKRILGLDEEN